MHVLYVHQNFPAQFGHIAKHLAREKGYRCTFISQTDPGNIDGIEKIQYHLAGGAVKQNHFSSRTFENCVWHADAVFQTLLSRRDIKPDLIVGHSGFGSTLFLPELYPGVPIINMFELFYKNHDPDSDMDFRKDLEWSVPTRNYLRSRARNAMILLDLQNCHRGYIPTEFQKSRFPEEFLYKIQVLFDGIDRSVYHGFSESLRPALGSRGVREVAGVTIPADAKVVTYVSRGFESMRGFDIFMKAAKIISKECPEAIFIIVGSDRICYGGDETYIKGYKNFKEWTLAQDQYDLSKFIFTGRIPVTELSKLLAMTDLHIYLTVPFVLSWSMMDAMSCGAVVLGSATSPVKEMIKDGENGLLADFFNPREIADKALVALNDIAGHRELGRAAERMIAERYSLEAVLPRMLKMYEEAVNNPPAAMGTPPPLTEKPVLAPPPPAKKEIAKSPFLS